MEQDEKKSPKSVEGARAAGMTRRQWTAGAIGFVGLILLGGTSAAASSANDSLLRPPGAQDEARLMELCVRCDRCRSVCPHNAIDVSHIEDGIISVRVPKMNFHLGYCDFCDGQYLCERVCPTQAILSGFEPTADKIGVARVDHAECLLDRLTGGCSKQCIDACAYGALGISDSGKIIVDESKCNGCGACEYACPSSSYAAYVGSGHRGINVERLESTGV